MLDHHFAICEPLLQAGDIDFGGVRDGMSGRQIFGFDLHAAAGAIEFEDADPFGIRCEGVFLIF